MRELEVLDSGHLKLEWEESKAFFEEELGEQVRSSVKQMLEQALEAERTARLAVGRYVRDMEVRRDYRNGYYRRDLGTRLGLLRGLRVPGAAKATAASCCRAISGGKSRCTRWCGKPFCGGFPPGRSARCWSRCWGKPIRRKPSRVSRVVWIRWWSSFTGAVCRMTAGIYFWMEWC